MKREFFVGLAACLALLLSGCASTMYRMADGVEQFARDVKSRFVEGAHTEADSPVEIGSVPEPAPAYLAGRIRLECAGMKGLNRRQCAEKIRELIARETVWNMRQCGRYSYDRTSYDACLRANVPNDLALRLPALSQKCLGIYRTPLAEKKTFILCQKGVVVTPIVSKGARSIQKTAKIAGRRRP